jgi:glucosyltransferase GtrII-like protein
MSSKLTLIYKRVFSPSEILYLRYFLIGCCIFAYFLATYTIMQLVDILSEDDYWIRHVSDGIKIQAAIDNANGRFLIGHIMEQIPRDAYLMITGVPGYLVTIFTMTALLAAIGWRLFGKNFLALTLFISIGLSHPYWVELFRFNLMMPGFIFSGFMLIMAVLLYSPNTYLGNTLTVALLSACLAIYQPYIYIFCAFLLGQLIIQDSHRKLSNFVMPAFVILMSLGLYYAVFVSLSDYWRADLAALESPIGDSIVSGRNSILSGTELVVSLLESFYYGLRSLLLPDGAVMIGTKFILMAFLLWTLARNYYSTDRVIETKIWFVLYIIALGWIASSPFHSVVNEDHYAFRSLIQNGIIFAIFPALAMKIAPSLASFVLGSIFVLSLSFSSYTYVQEAKDLQKQQLSLAHQIEREYNIHYREVPIARIDIPRRDSIEFRRLSATAPYIMPPIFHASTKFEFLASETNIPIDRFGFPESVKLNCQDIIVDKPFWFVPLNYGSRNALGLCYRQTINEINPSRLYKHLKTLKNSILGE